MPDTTTLPAFDLDSDQAPELVVPMPRQIGLTRQQLQAAASVLAYVHSRPHSFVPSVGSGSGPSPA